MELSGYSQIAPQSLYSSSDIQMATLGQRFMTADGREFAYCKAGELLVVGDFYQTAVHSSNYVSQALAVAASIGDTSVTITLGSSAATKDQFKDGYLIVSAGTGIGQMFLIKGNAAADAAASCVFTLVEPIRVALATANSTITVIKNRFDSIVKWAVTQTGSSAGAAVYPVASGEYGWVQVGGTGCALSDNVATAAETTGISPSTTTAGAITKAVTTQETIGGAAQVVTVSAEVGAIRLNLQ